MQVGETKVQNRQLPWAKAYYRAAPWTELLMLITPVMAQSGVSKSVNRNIINGGGTSSGGRAGFPGIAWGIHLS